jgi:peptidoglycan/LPS O-acetylase OafA/YrhL
VESRANVRSSQLDVLRAVAALLVMCMHVQFIPILSFIGWIGVDLFFVLSGFLISRLLFTETQHSGAIHVSRFYLRRAFKIYPPFWLLMAATPFIVYEPPPARQWVAELTFMQSYLEGIWGLTWSLSVEEHFYLLLPLLLLALLRRGGETRYSALPAIGAGLLVVCTTLRYLGVRNLGDGPLNVSSILRSHVRMDQLFVGVVIGYWFTRHRDKVTTALKRWHSALVSPMSAGLLIVMVAPKQVVLSVGLTVLSLGFGGMVLTAACAKPTEPGIFVRTMAEIGRSSYALYLWHIPMFVIFSRMTGFKPNGSVLTFAAYVAILIIWAILLTRCFEDPILAFRDRRFPSASRREKQAAIETALAAV